jgi:hypothetical protein
MIEKKRNMEGKSFLYNLIDNTGAFSNENNNIRFHIDYWKRRYNLKKELNNSILSNKKLSLPLAKRIVKQFNI